MSKEIIYLSIIIIYMLSKIIPAFLNSKRAQDLLGYKITNIKGLRFVIQKISPLDFLEDKSGFPLSFFNYEKGQAQWQQLRDNKDSEKMTPKQLKQAVELAKMICEKAVVYFPGSLKAEDFFKDEANAKTVEIAWTLYTRVLQHNLSFLKKPMKANRNYIIHVAELCAKFSTRPCDYFKSKGLSDIEKYMIDDFVYNTILSKENSIVEKRNRDAKKPKRRK